MQTDISVKRQLQELKALTVRLGVIHEAQALQLRNYPVLLLRAVWKTEVDIHSHTIWYSCTTAKRTRITKKMKEMFPTIVRFVRTIVWDDAVVVFLINGKVIYDSRL